MTTTAAPLGSPLADLRWEAVSTRNREFDGLFFYSVATTGVYCRPSCASRLPLRENVAFHESPVEAERAGFRPCKRCCPDGSAPAQQRVQQVVQACRLIEGSERPPTLAQLAAPTGLTPQHFHRLFKAVTGVTPGAYAQAHRAGRLAGALAAAGTITEAFLEAGYPSSARFYADAPARLGMQPRTYRRGAPDTELRVAIVQASLGAVLVSASPKGLCAVSLGDDPQALLRELQDRFPLAEFRPGDEAFDQLVAHVVAAVDHSATQPELQVPLDIRGTAFQQRVWEALRRIPPGETRTYAEVAAAVGAPRAVRAVAAACAANVLAVVVPCHRVVRTDQTVSGYRWGVDRKRKLLAREGASQ